MLAGGLPASAALTYTARIAATISPTGGLAKTSPHTAAVSIPLPTKPACAGSWPDPPAYVRAHVPKKKDGWDVK